MDINNLTAKHARRVLKHNARLVEPVGRKHQLGFSLVELGVVLLVVSILIGGVLKGKELIELSKMQRLEKDLEGLRASVELYRDYYQHLPGDDPNASRRFTSQGSVGDGNGNNRIDFSSGPDDGENNLFWQHLRAANLLKVAANDTRAPKNTFGGEITLRENEYGISGLLLVITGLTWGQAYTLDERQDDGNTGQGQIRIGIAGQILPTAPSSDANIIEAAILLN